MSVGFQSPDGEAAIPWVYAAADHKSDWIYQSFNRQSSARKTHYSDSDAQAAQTARASDYTAFIAMGE